MNRYVCLMLVLMTANPSLANTIAFDDGELGYWRVVNDTVMGGRSESRFYLQDGIGVFEGYLSLANSGGFASVRRYASPQFYSDGTVTINVKGDGRKYQLRLSTPALYRGMAYVAEFQTTKNTWQQINFNQSDFTVRYRGRLINGAPALDFANVQRLGILLADKNAGKFKLQIKSVEGFNAI